jgi:hypothetical protein
VIDEDVACGRVGLEACASHLWAPPGELSHDDQTLVQGTTGVRHLTTTTPVWPLRRRLQFNPARTTEVASGTSPGVPTAAREEDEGAAPRGRRGRQAGNGEEEIEANISRILQ